MGKTYKKKPSGEGKRMRDVSKASGSGRNKNIVGDYYKNPDNDFFDLKVSERKNRTK